VLSWRLTFHWFGIIGVVYGIILIVFLHENPKHDTAPAPKLSDKPVKKESLFKGLGVVLGTWAFWVILIYFAVPSLPGWATKNWLPTLFRDNLGISPERAGIISTLTIAAASFVGVIAGGRLSDNWVKKNIRGRVYTGAIGLGLTIPALILLGLGHSLVPLIAAGLLFGVGYGMFDANNMPILCQFISSKYRATAYGIMNMTGVAMGALVTTLLGRWKDQGVSLGVSFAVLGCIVIAALALQLIFLKPKTDNME
jgi:MFS family permease